MTTPAFSNSPGSPDGTVLPPMPQDAPQAAPDAPAAAPGPVVGDQVLHATYDALQGADRDVRMLVVGVQGDRIHAVSLGWADQYADLGPDDYRLP